MVKLDVLPKGRLRGYRRRRKGKERGGGGGGEDSRG